MIVSPWLPVPPPQYGGIENVIDELTSGLMARGHDVALYATGDSTSPALVDWTYDTAQIERIGNSAVELTHVVHAYDGAVSADVIHDHTLAGPVWAAAHGNLPVLTTNHGPFDAELTSIYRSIAHAVPIIAISYHQARTAGTIPIARVIHHGVDPGRFPVGTGDGRLCRLPRTNGAHQGRRPRRPHRPRGRRAAAHRRKDA